MKAKPITIKTAELEVTSRKLRNGNRLKITLETPYSEKLHKNLVDMNFKFVDVEMSESADQNVGLDFDDQKDGE